MESLTDMPMKMLELFAGSRSVSKAAYELGMDTMSTDIVQYGGIDVVGDILTIPIEKWVEYAPDVIHASPPCTAFSVASIGHHWRGGHRAYIPKTDEALLGLALLRRTIEIIEAVKPKVWYIENPRGLMRKMPETLVLPRKTIWYCRYGDSRAKPTDIWTNNNLWSPLPMCHNGNERCRHERAPRGAKTGTQGLKNAHVRAIIPRALCMEMMASAIECIDTPKP